MNGSMCGISVSLAILAPFLRRSQLVPYILDQFSQLWETPFSPTDMTFPCTIQRPSGLNLAQARQRMYMANHNLNFVIGLGRLKFLVPDIFHIARTNALSGFGSLGAAVEGCVGKWCRTFPSIRHCSI